VGCVIVPANGADGVDGCVLITTFNDAAEVHPTELVTVKVRVPGTSPEMVALKPEPAMAPGLITQFPEGKSFNSTLPVETEQVGWVMVPAVGDAGVAGWVLMITFVVAGEVHPTEFVTVNE
jgi:hypothetical protein